VTVETLMQPVLSGDESLFSNASDRRADIEAKMARTSNLIQESGCEGLLILEPENFSWLTSGATDRALPYPAGAPVLYCNGDNRWLIASNVDSQRLFDEELEGLGFQLKEWPWHWGRDQLLADLCQNRRLACDRPLADTKLLADGLRRLRLVLTPYDQACYRALGQMISHALEATCRTLAPGETEREIAGQICHRLIHRGVQPLHVGVAADGRSRHYRLFGYTSVPVQSYALLTVTGRKYGLVATATRAVHFGALSQEYRQDLSAVCRVSASYLASTWPDAVPREILLAGRRIYLLSGYEHEWTLGPQGQVTGRAPVEVMLSAQTTDLFQPGWAVCWNAHAGAVASCDTFLITDQGPREITPTESWPLKRIRIQGADFVRPDILQR